MAPEIIVDRDVQRVFHIRCSCGAPIVSTENTATCSRCGNALEVRRLRKRGRSPIVVEYHFDCSYCNANLVTTNKKVTCTNCGKTLKILRAEKPPRTRNVLLHQIQLKRDFKQWLLGMAGVLILLIYVLDLLSC